MSEALILLLCAVCLPNIKIFCTETSKYLSSTNNENADICKDIAKYALIFAKLSNL